MKKRKSVIRHVSKYSLHKKIGFFQKNKIILTIIIAAIIIIGVSMYIILKSFIKPNLSELQTWVCNTADSLQSSSNACNKIDFLKFINKDMCCKGLEKCCIK